jgi:hypothetical protein
VVSIAFSVLLFDEYRLTVNGLLFGLFALGFTAIGKLPILIQFRTNQSNSNVQAYLSWNTILRIVVSLSIVITASWAIFVENTFSAIESLVRVNPWKVVLNLGLVFCTCVFGSSSAVLSYQESLFSFDAAPELFLFAGLTSLSDLMSARRSYSAYSQVLVFAFAFVMSFIRGWGSNAQFNQEEEDNIEKWAASGQDEHTFRFSSDSDPEAHSTDDLLVHLEVTRPSRGVCETSMHAYRTSRFRTIVRGYKIVSSWSGLSRASYMMIAFGIWCSFSYLNFSLDTRTAQNNHTPSLDLSYHSKFDLDIVMSMYDEDPVSVAAMISELRRLPNIANKTTRVLIYFKGKGQDVYIEALKHRTGATEMIHLPNIGREGESYLYHIISKYDDLAKHTLFLQAHVHNSWELKRRIGHYFVPNTGMLNLGFSEACDCNDCWDRFGWHDNVVSGLHQSVYNSTCSDILLSYKGQFIVSAQRIRGSDPKIYSALQEALVDPDSWAHKEPYLRGRPDSMSAPRFGYTLERLWSILFQCSEMDIVEKCPTLLSGTRSGGELSDCQCLDGTAPMEPLSA